MSPNRLQIAVAEFIGTFALTFIGILSISSERIIATGPTFASLAVVAFAHGLILAAMIAALGHVSGGHFNPAVTFGFLLTGRIWLPKAVVYWGAQLGGAVVASLLLSAMAGNIAVTAGTPAVPENVGNGMGAVLEAMGTFFLVMAVFGSAVDERAPRGAAPWAIGMTLVAVILAIGPITGGAVNPARAIGPALATGQFSQLWVYLAGPLIGGGLAAIVHQVLLSPSRQMSVRPAAAPAEAAEKRR
jgi:aquaporin TIP